MIVVVDYHHPQVRTKLTNNDEEERHSRCRKGWGVFTMVVIKLKIKTRRRTIKSEFCCFQIDVNIIINFWLPLQPITMMSTTGAAAT